MKDTIKIERALEAAKRWHQGDKWRDGTTEQRAKWEDHQLMLDDAIAALSAEQQEEAQPIPEGWIFMREPTRFNGNWIPVRVWEEDGVKLYMPWEENGCDLEWDQRSDEWEIYAAPSASAAPVQPQEQPKPVMWVEVEESARGQNIADVLRNHMMYSMRYYQQTERPVTGNPVWPLYAAPVTVQHAKPERDREADRARFTDPLFNQWLDEGISDAGHTVWDQIGNVCDAWHGWENSRLYAAQDVVAWAVEDPNGNLVDITPMIKKPDIESVNGYRWIPLTRCATSKEASLANQALMEAKREGVGEHYRLVMLRQREHAEAGRFKEANECVAIRAEFERMASSKEASAPARDDGLQRALNDVLNELAGRHEYPSLQRLIVDALEVLQSHPAQAGKDSDLEARDRVAKALGLSSGVTVGEKRVSFAWEYLLGMIEECVKACEDAAAPAASVPVQVTLTPAEIEQGWRDTFSTSNPFCPCDLGAFTKAVKWAERRLLAGSAKTGEAE